MSFRHVSWLIVVTTALVLAFGCAPEAADKMVEAEQDLAAAWQAERDAAVAEMKAGITAADERIAAMRAHAAELEAQAEAEAAAAWRRTADHLAEARDAAAREVAALESAGAQAWQSTKDGAAKAVAAMEHAGRRAEAFAAETRDAFVAEARAVVEEGERDLAFAMQKLAEADEAAKEDWQKIVNELDEKQRAAVAELARIEAAAADAWADLRHGFVAAYHDLRVASAKAVEDLGDM